MKTSDRLNDLLPELEFSKETHRQWRDYLIECPEALSRNPDIGGAEFHDRMVSVYDERIDAIQEAINELG